MSEEPEFIFLQFLGGSALAAHPTNFCREIGDKTRHGMASVANHQIAQETDAWKRARRRDE